MSELVQGKMPVIFVGHGNPMNTLTDNVYTRTWKNLGHWIPTPSAILCVSAHWTTRGTWITGQEWPPTIHDFRGFPAELFSMQYAARGDLGLAKRVQELLAPVQVGLDDNQGLDHGTWSVLAHVYPRADIPVLQLSIDATQEPAYHYRLGRALMALRREGVLIMGSGNIVHNLGRMDTSPNAPPQPWAQNFNLWVRSCIEESDDNALTHYLEFGTDAVRSVPTPEHFLPLLYCLGLREVDDTVSFPTDGIESGAISMLSVGLGLNEESLRQMA